MEGIVVRNKNYSMGTFQGPPEDTQEALKLHYIETDCTRCGGMILGYFVVEIECLERDFQQVEDFGEARIEYGWNARVEVLPIAVLCGMCQQPPADPLDEELMMWYGLEAALQETAHVEHPPEGRFTEPGHKHVGIVLCPVAVRGRHFLDTFQVSGWCTRHWMWDGDIMPWVPYGMQG